MQKLSVRKIPIRLLLGTALFVALLLFFGLLAHEVVGEKEDWFDSRVFGFFQAHHSPAWIEVCRVLTFLGSTYFLFPAYGAILIWLCYDGRKADAVEIGLLGSLSTVLLFLLKSLFARSRPENPLFTELTNYSFPSGHALSSFVFCSALAWLLWKSDGKQYWKIILSLLLLLLALGIGISRIVLRYHYASDVVAGFCMGCAWVLLYLWLHGIVEGRRTVRRKMVSLKGGKSSIS